MIWLGDQSLAQLSSILLFISLFLILHVTGMKYSPYAKRVNRYRVLPEYKETKLVEDLDKWLKRLLERVIMDVFRPAMNDVLRRHQGVQSHIIDNSLVIQGASLGKLNLKNLSPRYGITVRIQNKLSGIFH